ncbi:MAG: serpin family protein [Pseudomonadota bacterium]
MKRSAIFTRTRLAQLALLVLGGTAAACALAQPKSTPSPTGTAAPAPPKTKAKDIVLDGAAPPSGALVATPGAPGAGAMVATPGAPATAPRPARRANTPAHDSASAGALAELALDMLRQQSAATGNAQENAVVSPLSLAAALGMIHAGTSGAGAQELAKLMGSQSSGERFYSARLPAILDRLAKPGETGLPFVMANRVWVDKSVLPAIPPTYGAIVTDRFNADAAVLAFAQAGAARAEINAWVGRKTAGRIPELMPEGSVSPSTKLVATNAIHFKSKWFEPFDPQQTVPKPFHVGPGAAAKQVPTMVDERQVRIGTVDNISVFELPFAGEEYTLLLGMAPAGHTLNALETDLEGLDLASWSAQLKPTRCRLELPKFSIAPASVPLKPALQALGVKTVFGQDADFSALLGHAGKGVMLDNVYQSATIIIDERGGEAAAATGAAGAAKSFSLPAPACAVDRPFIFAVMHRASGTPLFVGKVADPSQH